jgi:hypothetical protein
MYVAVTVSLLRRQYGDLLTFLFDLLGTVACNNNVGVLPPVADDCATIQASFQIFSSELADTFTTESNHFESLIFGTCTIFFNNLGKSELEYCWNDLVRNTANYALCPNEFNLLMIGNRQRYCWRTMLPSGSPTLLRRVMHI